MIFYKDHRITYLYDAMGIKRHTTHYTVEHRVGTPIGGIGIGIVTPGYSVVYPTHTDYCGSVVYENGALKRILTPEGYLTYNSLPGIGGGGLEPGTPIFMNSSSPASSSGGSTTGSGSGLIMTTPSYQYHYFIKDHSGNNRAVITWNKNGLSTTDYFLTQQIDYYPFGMPFEDSMAPEAQPYKREGKELDEMYGLNWYDFHNRQFGMDLPITPTPDPLAEKYPHISPYAQWANNPVRYVDPDGRDI